MQHQPTHSKIHPQIRSEAQLLFEASPLETGELLGNERSWGWALDDFLELLAEYHDQPVEALRPMIQRVVAERAFLDYMGDRMGDRMTHDSSVSASDGESLQSQFEGQVDQIVAVLEKVRQYAMSRGQWSDLNSPPLMCG